MIKAFVGFMNAPGNKCYKVTKMLQAFAAFDRQVFKYYVQSKLNKNLLSGGNTHF